MSMPYTEHEIRRRATNLGWLVAVVSIPIGTAVLKSFETDFWSALLLAALFVAPSAGLVAYLLSAFLRRAFSGVAPSYTSQSSALASPPPSEASVAPNTAGVGFAGKASSALGTIAFIVVLIVAGGIGDGAGKIASWFLLGPSHEQLVAQTASELNKKLPMMIDRETRMDNTQIGPASRSLIYNYTLVNYRAVDISASGLVALERQVTDTTCRQRTTNLLKRNMSLEFRYRSADGVLIKAFVVSPQSCG